jgi:hypothetical protein
MLVKVDTCNIFLENLAVKALHSYSVIEKSSNTRHTRSICRKINNTKPESKKYCYTKWWKYQPVPHV